jgi:non-homologous end joining protein Ku
MPRASWRGFLRLSLVSCPYTYHRRRRARNRFACTRSGNRLLPRPMNQKTTCRIEAEDSTFLIHPGCR